MCRRNRRVDVRKSYQTLSYLITAVLISVALVTGSTVVLKPASDTPASALLITQMIEKDDFPPGVFNVVMGQGGRNR